MAMTIAPHARLAVALVLAMMGVACSPTALPLPMLSTGHSHAQSSAPQPLTTATNAR